MTVWASIRAGPEAGASAACHFCASGAQRSGVRKSARTEVTRKPHSLVDERTSFSFALVLGMCRQPHFAVNCSGWFARTNLPARGEA